MMEHMIGYNSSSLPSLYFILGFTQLISVIGFYSLEYSVGILSRSTLIRSSVELKHRPITLAITIPEYTS